MIPSNKESECIIYRNAMHAAKNILSERAFTFRLARSKEEVEENVEQKKLFIEKEDYIGAAASHMQNCNMLKNFSMDDDVTHFSNFLSDLGNDLFYDEGKLRESLRCFQLAAGICTHNEDAIKGAITVYLQGGDGIPEEALPYGVILENIHPECKVVDYILHRMLYKHIFLERDDMQSSRTDWNTARGDFRRTGNASCSIIPPLKLNWTFDKCAWIHNGIVVSREIAVFGDMDGIVHAVNMRNGSTLWIYKLPGIQTGTPAIRDDRIYIGTSKHAICLDLKNGKLLWEQKIDGSAGKRNIGSINSILCYKNLVIYADEKLNIFHAGSGNIIASINTHYDPWPHSGACYDEKHLYIPGDGKILRLNLLIADWLEPIKTKGKITCGPVIADDLLLYGTNRAAMHAVSTRSRKHVWSFKAEGLVKLNNMTQMDSSPAVSKGRVFFGGPDGYLHALDLKTGKKIWQVPFEDNIESSPTVSGNAVYILNSRGFFACSVSDGEKLWEFRTGEKLSYASCDPIVGSYNILIGWDKLYCFRERS